MSLLLIVVALFVNRETFATPTNNGYYYPVPKIPFLYPNELENAYVPPRRPSSEYGTPFRGSSRVRVEENSRRRPTDDEDLLKPPKRTFDIDETLNPDRRTTTTSPPVFSSVINNGREMERRRTSRPRIEEELTREEALNKGPDVIGGNRTRTRVINKENGGREIVTEEVIVLPNDGGRLNSKSGIITTMMNPNPGVVPRNSISDIINNNSARSSSMSTSKTTMNSGLLDELFVRTASGATRKISDAEAEEIIKMIRSRQRGATTTTTVTGSARMETKISQSSASSSSAMGSGSRRQNTIVAAYPQGDDDISVAAGSSHQEDHVIYNRKEHNNLGEINRLLVATPEEIAFRTGADFIN